MRAASTARFPDGPASSTVSVTVSDSDGASDSDTLDVTVSNVAPTVDAGAATGTVAEGSTFTRSGSFTDPGADTWSATVNYGDGSGVEPLTLGAGKTFNLSHLYTDGLSTHTITVVVTDDDLDSGTDTIVITVTNVAPTIAVSGAATTNEGSQLLADPRCRSRIRVRTRSRAYIVHWGDGGSNTYPTRWRQDPRATPTDPNGHTITVDLVDEDGTFANAGSKAVSVLNVAPTVAFTGGPTAVSEHAATQQTFTYSITDPGQDSQTVVVSCGAGGALVSGSASNTATGGSFKCVFDDGPATEVVSATATDSDVATGNSATRSVAVSNVAPTITSLTSNPTAAVIGQTIVITASAVDPSGADTTAGFQWHFDTGSGFGAYGAVGANTASKTITSLRPAHHPGPGQGQGRRRVRDRTPSPSRPSTASSSRR